MKEWIQVKERLPEIRVDNSGNILSDNVLLLCKSDPIIRIGFCRGLISWDIINADGYFESVADFNDVVAWSDIPPIPAWYEEE